MRKTLPAIAMAFVVAAGAGTANAAEAVEPPSQDWSFTGIFGTFDRGAAQRGLQVYQNVCASCHSLELVAFRQLAGIGLSEQQIEAVAESFEVTDGPNEEGDMFTRPGKPADHFPPPFPNEQAARVANGGALPPDLSLIVKWRGGDSVFTKVGERGADYVYGVLTGYEEEPPADVELMAGMYYNEYFAGHQIAMAPPLYPEAVEYADGTEPTVDQHAYDVASFLSWAAQPELEERKRMGVKVILFLIVLTGMLYAVKRKIWSDLH